MMTSETITTAEPRFNELVAAGLLSEQALKDACTAAAARGLALDRILQDEYAIPRQALLEALSRHYACSYIEYDERLPIPTALFAALNAGMLSRSLWFPVIKEDDKVIIAACFPDSPAVRDEVGVHFKTAKIEFRVTLTSDIRWYIQDFLHAEPTYLIGIERTGLAFWRNTMAHWRTRLASYRTDLAKGRTALAFLRSGLGLMALSDVFLRTRQGLSLITQVYWAMMLAGFALSVFGFVKYVQVRGSKASPPKHHTLVEVTAATMMFLERYHLPETPTPGKMKATMLGRLGDLLTNYCTILNPIPASKERTHLARERNVLAAQRTLAACYRTIYSRARTGLAFIRTGVAFLSMGLGFLQYFSLGLLSAIDFFLIAAGIIMTVDGILWYMPVRKEQEISLRTSAT